MAPACNALVCPILFLQLSISLTETLRELADHKNFTSAVKPVLETTCFKRPLF